jgi:hypothetical protein
VIRAAISHHITHTTSASLHFKELELARRRGAPDTGRGSACSLALRGFPHRHRRPGVISFCFIHGDWHGTGRDGAWRFGQNSVSPSVRTGFWTGVRYVDGDEKASTGFQPSAGLRDAKFHYLQPSRLSASYSPAYTICVHWTTCRDLIPDSASKADERAYVASLFDLIGGGDDASAAAAAAAAHPSIHSGLTKGLQQHSRIPPARRVPHLNDGRGLCQLVHHLPL